MTGILAGVHPCGVIALIGELFGAESKGQVYGHLHSFLSINECATSSISMLSYYVYYTFITACTINRYSLL